jgi:dephospho-CoA kinase
MDSKQVADNMEKRDHQPKRRLPKDLADQPHTDFRAGSSIFLVGLTGSIASGKSTVARGLAKKGAHIIDFDMLAREVVEPGKPAYDDIVSFFGSGVLLADNTLDRKKLSGIVFTEADKRKKLEGFTHPRISDAFLLRLGNIAAADPHAVVVAVIPLLIEQNMQGWFHKIIVVYCQTEILVERLMKREGLGRESAQRMVSSQISMNDKIPFADYVIDNSGDTAVTVEQTTDVWEQLQKWKRGCLQNL